MTFLCPYKIKIFDLNYGNHVGHDRVVSIMHHARWLFFKDIGCSENRLFKDNNGIIVKELSVKYISQMYVDDEINIEIYIKDLNEFSFHMLYEIKKNDILCIKAHTKLVSFDFQLQKIEKINETFKHSLLQYMRSGTRG